MKPQTNVRLNKRGEIHGWLSKQNLEEGRPLRDRLNCPALPRPPSPPRPGSVADRLKRLRLKLIHVSDRNPTKALERFSRPRPNRGNKSCPCQWRQRRSSNMHVWSSGTRDLHRGRLDFSRQELGGQNQSGHAAVCHAGPFCRVVSFCRSNQQLFYAFCYEC